MSYHCIVLGLGRVAWLNRPGLESTTESSSSCVLSSSRREKYDISSMTECPPVARWIASELPRAMIGTLMKALNMLIGKITFEVIRRIPDLARLVSHKS